MNEARVPRFFTESELRKRKSIKWNRYRDSTVIPADFAEMDFGTAPRIMDSLNRLLGEQDFGYPDYDHGAIVDLRDAYSSRIKEKNGIKINPERIEVIGQIIQGICCCLLVYTNEGDSVILQSPIYPPIRRAVAALRRQVIELPVEWTGDRFATKVEALPGLIKSNTKMLVLCNPHNPTGSVLEDNELSWVSELVGKYGLQLVVDEVHQDFVFKGRRFLSALKYNDKMDGRCITLTSAAKSHNIPGLRCATIYFGNKDLHRIYCALPWHMRSGASLPGIVGTLSAWRESEDWLNSVYKYLEDSRELVFDMLCGEMPPGAIVKPASTFFYWINFRALNVVDARKFFIEHSHVAMQEGSIFGSECGGMLRFNYAMDQSLLVEVLGRIKKAVQKRLKTEVLDL